MAQELKKISDRILIATPVGNLASEVQKALPEETLVSVDTFPGFRLSG
jgi:hypothetical protein